jgi:hypothetical protein
VAHPPVDPLLVELAAALPTVAAEDLPRFEVRVRSRWRYAPREPLLGELAGPHAFGFMSFHPNGYRREEAVERLALIRDDAALRYLILRMTDWVPQVRERARRAVTSRLHEAAIWNHFFLLTRAARADADLLQSLVRIAAGDAHRSMLEAAARIRGETARSIFRFLLDHVTEARRAAIEAGAVSNDSVIRTWVTPLVDTLPLLVSLASDRVPAVRTRALTALAKSFPDEARPLLESAVLDRSAAVREIVRFLLGPRDYAASYRHALAAAQTARPIAAALTGLAETGNAADAELAVAMLDHSTAAVRRAAVKCVMRLAGDAFAERITGMLADPAAGVSAAVRDTLRGRALERPVLMEIFESTRAPHVRRNAVSLFAALPKWQSIIALLSARSAGEDALRFVQQWNRNYNRSQTPPSRGELEELRAVFADAEPALDRLTAEALRFTLRSFPPAPAPPPGSRL